MAHCTLLQADDLKYLGFRTEEVPETVYLLFKEAELLQSREDMWELRKREILALPDPLKDMSPEQRYGYDWILSEQQTVFKKYIQPGQIEFRAMPHGNVCVVRAFTTHFVIDINIVSSQEEVHKRLAALLESDYDCQQPCQCQRKLLVDSMIDGLCRQKGGPSRERIWHNIMAQYMLVSQPSVNLPMYTNTTNSPAVGCPNSASSSTPPVVRHSDTNTVRSAAIHEGSFEGLAASMDDLSAVDLAGLSIGGVASRQHGSQNGALHMGGSASRPQAFKVVQERETPAMPGVQDPVLFHNGIQAALESVLKHSAGQECAQGFLRSCNHPSAGGAADTVTVRLCPDQSKNPLTSSPIMLASCITSDMKQLYLPEGFDLGGWTQAMSVAVQQLYHLLERLHELFLPGVAPVNLYYDANDGCIAFNRGNKLWYNAHADHAYGQSQGVRLFNWYITVCHELAHNFRREHDEVFSDYLAHIALQHSKAFYLLCDRYDISM